MNIQDFLKGFHPAADGIYTLDTTTLDLPGVCQMGTAFLGGTTWVIVGAACDPVGCKVTGKMALPGSPQPLDIGLTFLGDGKTIVGVQARLASTTLNLKTSYVHWDVAQVAPTLAIKSANMGFAADAKTCSASLGFSVAMDRTPTALLLDLWTAIANSPQEVIDAPFMGFSVDLTLWPEGAPLGHMDALKDLAPNAKFSDLPSIFPLKTTLLTGLQFMAWVQRPSNLPILSSMEVVVQIDKDVTVVDGFFDLDELDVILIFPDYAGKNVYYTLSGVFDLGHLLGTTGPTEKFGMALRWDPKEQSRLKLLGAPEVSLPVMFFAEILTPISLEAVLKKCLGVSDLGPLKNLDIAGLSVQGNMASGMFELNILLSGTLNLFDKVSLSGLEMCVRRNSDKTWSGLVSSTFDLGGYRLLLNGVYDQGWSFFGVLDQQRKDPPTMADFFKSFGDTLGVTVPSDVGSMSRLVSLNFSAVFGDAPSLDMTLQGQTNLCDKEIGVLVTASLSRQQGQVHQAFTGTLYVEDPKAQDGAKIEVSYADHTFSGTWINGSGQGASKRYALSDILNWFGLDALDDLPLLLPDTLIVEHTTMGVGITLGMGVIQGGLARLTPAVGKNAAWVAALQIDLGLTFSKTPLASSGLPAGQDFGLPNTLLMYANAVCASLTPVQQAVLFGLMPTPTQGLPPPGFPTGGLDTGLALDPTLLPANLLGQPLRLPQGTTPAPHVDSSKVWEVLDPEPVHSLPVTRSWDSRPRPLARVIPMNVGDAASGVFAWVPINKTLGPVTIGRLGIGYMGGGKAQIALGVDAGFSIDGFSLEFIGLTLAHDFKADAKISVGLQGLSVGYNDGLIDVQGQFMEVQGKNGTEYVGDVSLSLLDMVVAVDGAYGKVKNPDGGEAASLFIFGLMSEPLGGAPWCYITGLAAGAGINRDLLIPSLQDLPQFPLVAAAVNPTGPANPFGANTTPDTALTIMENVLPPAYGSKWFAFGVRFSSFGLLESFALMTASFGARTQIGLLGVSAMTLPRGSEDPIAYAELALEATLDPDAGTLTVSGQLTPQSYVISPACQLQGGFGFAAWFKDQNVSIDGVTSHICAGDFALSLGGYHPLFNPPAYYPKPQLVSANWQVDDHMSINGYFYFALTPGALMAGGGLNAVWESSGLRAWFNESADFLLGWRPFRYAADINLSLGVSYTLDLLFTSVTIGVSLGVDVSLAGPPLHGKVHVDLYVVSFTISFGDDDDRSEQTPISWDDFKKALLPSEIQPPSTHRVALGDPVPVTVTDSMCRARAVRGLAKDLSASAKSMQPLDLDSTASAPTLSNPALLSPDWIFTGHDFEVSTESVFASTSLVQGTQSVTPTWALGIEAGPAGAREKAYASTHTVSLLNEEGVEQTAQGGPITVTPVLQALPLANWNVDAATQPTADHLNQRVINNGLVGTRLTPSKKVYDHLPTPVAMTLLASEEEVPAQPILASSGFVAPTQTFPQTKAEFDGISSVTAQNARNTIIRQALRDGANVQTTCLLSTLSNDRYLIQAPRVVATGA